MLVLASAIFGIEICSEHQIQREMKMKWNLECWKRNRNEDSLRGEES